MIKKMFKAGGLMKLVPKEYIPKSYFTKKFASAALNNKKNNRIKRYLKRKEAGHREQISGK